MSVNINEVNLPLNKEKRDPFYGRSKSEIGLGNVQNMSFDSIQTSILANVRSYLNDGITYNYEDYASDSNPIVADIVKLKPNSSSTVLNFSLGTWTENSEFIPRESATLELRSNKTNVSYNLHVTEPYPKNDNSDSTDSNINKSTSLTSTKVIIREINTGGWLVSIKIIDSQTDAIWINFGDSRNIEVLNPSSNLYGDSDLGRSIEFYCDKSRISTNLEIGGASLIAKSLNHPVPIKLNPVDPNDYYNNQSNTYSLSNIDLGGLIGTPDLIKDDTIVSIPILTDEETCSKDQLIPMSVNRLNHQIKLRFTGSIHNSQYDSWKMSQSDQSNLSSFLDTDPESINEFPLSITELTHDIDVKIGKGSYYGTLPESGKIGGLEYGRYEFDDYGNVNYASISNETNGRNEFYSYDSLSKSWKIVSDPLRTSDNSCSLSTKSGYSNDLNLVIHGLDHNIKIEVANSNYRYSRGLATDSNNLLNSTKKINSGIKNLTWEESDIVENETRRNSYITGNISINTFEKDIYQCLDLSVHGMDHNINMEFFRIDTNVLNGPNSSSVELSDKYRPNSEGKDILGNISIDTFTKRSQKFRMEVIDGRYSDCSRGLAITNGGNYIPYNLIDENGGYGNYLPDNPSSDEIRNTFPTINGIPFTGDFRHRIKYSPDLEIDGIPKEHSARNINIPAYHKNSSLEGSGSHKWEVLENLRISSINENGIPVSRLINSRYNDSDTEIENGYGLVRLTAVEASSETDPIDRLTEIINSLSSNDEDVVTVKALKLLMNAIIDKLSE